MYGSLHLSDIPAQIKDVYKDKKDLSFYVKWEKRNNGTQPLDSFVLGENLRKKFPQIIIDFYEKNMIFNWFTI